MRPDGALITGNDPTDTSVAIDPSFVQGWIDHLVSQFGTAAQGGVAYYNLDNEPMLWNDTHRDVHPLPTSYDEIRDRTYAYAAAIKAADPTARTLGPAVWGWDERFIRTLKEELIWQPRPRISLAAIWTLPGGHERFWARTCLHFPNYHRKCGY